MVSCICNLLFSLAVGPLTAAPTTDKNSNSTDANQGLHLPFKYELHSKHFSFYAVTKSESSKNYADYLEDFLAWLNTNLIAVPPKWHLSVYLYPDVATLNAEGCTRGMRRKMEGRFVQSQDAVFSYEECGIGTLTHELMHKVLHENFKELEPWAKEGIPTLFECLYGYKTAAEPNLYIGFQSPWRLRELDTRLSRLTLAEITSPRAAEDPYEESDKRMLSTFLVAQGKLKEYVGLARSGNHRGYNTLVEATFRKQMNEIEPEFKSFIDTIVRNRTKLMAAPPSAYFHERHEFEDFCKRHATALQCPPNPGVAKRMTI
jgi:hypothetical protein